MRLLFVYGFAPSGHASAARALEARARALGHETSCLDISADYHRILGPAINNIYLALIQSFPNLWTTLHDNESAADVLSLWREIYHLFEGQRLRETVEQLQPDRIVCTHAGPFAALALAKEKGHVAAKLTGVLTDFHPHPYWAVPGADLYVTADEAAARVMERRGIPRERLVPAGIPVHPLFESAGDREAERQALEAPEGAPVVLVTGGSRGLGRMVEAVEALLAGVPHGRVLAVCGSNEALLERLRSLEKRQPRLRAFGALPAERVKALMSAADLMVGKAGGLTSAECLCLGLPMVVLDPIPGQEQNNAAHLVEAGAAAVASDLAALPELTRSLLQPARLSALRAAAAKLGRAGAGARALEAILI